jgi:hypothetical protein
MSPLLSSRQQHHLREALTAEVSHLTAHTPTTRSSLAAPTARRHPATTPTEPCTLPVLYTIVLPKDRRRSLYLRAEHLDPSVWELTRDPRVVLTAFAVGVAQLARYEDDPPRRGTVYGYAFAYHPVTLIATATILHTEAPSAVNCVLRAAGRDGVVYASPGAIGDPYRSSVIEGLLRLAAAASGQGTRQ